jgi:hypothetical protein
MSPWHFLCSLALIGILFFGSSSLAAESATHGQTVTAQRIEWIDVHVHLVGGRIRDFEGAAHVALKAMDGAGVRTRFVMPPPQPPGHPVLYDYDSFVPCLRRFRGVLPFSAAGERSTR